MTGSIDNFANPAGQGLRSSLALLTAVTLLLTCSGTATAAYPEDPDAWKFDAQLYLWGASLKGKTIIAQGVDESFGDLLDNLDMAFMGTFAAQKGKWAMLGDVLYLNLEEKESTTLPGPTPVPVDVKFELKGWVVNLLGGYTVVQSERNAFSVIAGARYLRQDVDLNLVDSNSGASLAQLSDTDGAWNGVIGLQGQAGFAKRWYVNYFLDVGTGDSDFTWQALAGLGYEFRNLDLKFGYRHLAWEFDDSDAFGQVVTEIEVSGPYAGIKFKF